jgi:hypothetical protein
MYFVFCSATDAAAVWACEGLGRLGLAPVTLVTDGLLALSADWSHRLGAAGVETRFTLPAGRCFDSREVRGVLNRLLSPPTALVAQSVPQDRDYAQQELTALYLSWLHALPVPVLNRPTPQGLSGRWRHGSEWAAAAHRAGFRVPPFRQGAASPPDAGYRSMAPPGAQVRHVVVVGDEVFGAGVPQCTRDACLQLARQCETPLLGIDLYATEDPADWAFAAATPLPDLRVGGEPLLHRLASLLH